MIDIHNHMLPAVDDGAKDSTVALNMLQEAVTQGIEHLVLTPHLYEADIVNGTAEWKTKVTEASKTLRAIIKEHQISIEVSVAAEVRYQDMMPIILDELDVLIGGKYLLLEFPFQSVPRNIERVIYEIMTKGIVPIIAHPERIKPWQRDPQRLEELLVMGCPLQVDIGSFLGTLGPNTEVLANLLFERDAVHLVGSDSHDMQNRPLYAKAGYDWISKRYSHEHAEILLRTNPAKVLAGENISVYPPNLEPIPLSLRERISKLIRSNRSY